MNRTCIFIAMALLGLTRTLIAASTNWPPVDYVEVRAYLYNLDGDQAAPIWEQGKLNASVWNPEGAALNKKQMAKVLKAVADHYPAGLAPRRAVISRAMPLFIMIQSTSPLGLLRFVFPAGIIAPRGRFPALWI